MALPVAAIAKKVAVNAALRVKEELEGRKPLIITSVVATPLIILVIVPSLILTMLNPFSDLGIDDKISIAVEQVIDEYSPDGMMDTDHARSILAVIYEGDLSETTTTEVVTFITKYYIKSSIIEFECPGVTDKVCQSVKNFFRIEDDILSQIAIDYNLSDKQITDIESYYNLATSDSDSSFYYGDVEFINLPLVGDRSDMIVTSPFGWRVIFGKENFHRGVDLIHKDGDLRLLSVYEGEVVVNGYNGESGYHIIIYHEDYDFYTYYAHLASSSKKQVGDNVIPGEVVGVMGTTGSSTGVHLHFGIKRELHNWNNDNFLNAQEMLGFVD